MLNTDVDLVVSFLAKFLGRLGFIKENPNLNIARKILEEHGQNSLEYFKLGEDKSFYFSQSKKSFLAYRIFTKNVMILGDPVGPYSELEALVNRFHQICRHKNYTLCFFQASSLYADIYKKLDFNVSIIGNEGLVNLPSFDLKDISKVELRKQMRTLDAFRYKVRYYKNPSDKTLLQKLRNISNDWLSSGEKERVFYAGAFSENYIKTTTVMTVEDMVGNIVAFINLIPSYRKNDLGIDLIRKSKIAPEGTLEYLLTHTILFFRELGYQRLSLGLVPLVDSSNANNFENALAKILLTKMSFLFCDMSLKSIKEKFIDILEPRYFSSSKAQKLNKQSPKLLQTSLNPN